MENNNLGPEEDKLERDAAAEASQTSDIPQVTEETGAPEAVQDSTALEESTSAPVGDNPTGITTSEPPVKKSKTGLIVGAVAALLVVAVVAVVAGVALVGQPPEKVVKNALKASYDISMKQEEKIKTELPMLARSTELAEQGNEKKVDFKLNSITIPGVSPLISMTLGGAAVSGTTISSPDTHTYSNSYGLTFMGQNMGTLNLYNSPTVISIEIPEYLKRSYYLDVDKMVENSEDSYIFGEYEKEDLQAFADFYKAYMTAIGSISTSDSGEINNQLNKICAETLTGIEYNTIKSDGKKLYTVTIPAESVNAMISSLIKYVYLESPVSGSILSMLPPAEKAEFENQLNNMTKDIAEIMPTSPTVVTLDISKGIITNVDVLTEGVSSGDTPVPTRLSMNISDLTGANTVIGVKFEAGNAEDRVEMDMTINTTYADKAIGAVMSMNVNIGESDALINMMMDYKLDGSKPTDNASYNIEYVVKVPMDGMSMKVNADTVGDYYLKDGVVVLAMDDINYSIVADGFNTYLSPTEINMNLGINMATAPFTGEIVQPVGVDMLTLDELDLVYIYEEFQESIDVLFEKFIGMMNF